MCKTKTATTIGPASSAKANICKLRRLAFNSLLPLAILLLAAQYLYSEESTWQRRVGIGFNMTSGNSDTKLFNTDLSATTKRPRYEFVSDAQITYGKSDGETTVENGNTKAQYNRLFSARTYAYFNAEAAYDKIAHLDYRYMTGPGAGYYLVKNTKQNFSLELGLAYLKEKTETPPQTSEIIDDVKDQAIILRLIQKYDIILTETSKAWESTEYLPEINDLNKYLINAEMGIDSAINAHFNLRLVIQEKYDSMPAVDIKNHDTTIKSALVYSF